MSTNRSNDRSSLCSFMFVATAATAVLWSAAVLPPLSRLKLRPSTPARKPTSTTLCALCALLSVPSVVNPFPRSQGLTGQGQLKPKTASTLAYLGQTLVQTLPLAQHEY